LEETSSLTNSLDSFGMSGENTMLD